MPTFGNEKLHTFTCPIPQPLQGRARRLGKTEPALSGEPAKLDEAPAEAVPAAGVLFDQPVCRQGCRQTVRRRSRKARAHDKPGKAQGPCCGEAVEDANSLAERTSPLYTVSHNEMISHNVGHSQA